MSSKFATVFCDECKYEFSMYSVNICETTMELGGQTLKLVYFTCPKCNKIYRVTLKDARYEELKEDLERTKKRIRKNHGSGNDELARMLNEMVGRKLHRLRNHTTELNRKFPGTFIFAVPENGEGKIIKYLP